jgi:4-hydroxybenzoate polyprenyltransferase
MYWLGWAVTAVLCILLTLRLRHRQRESCFAVFKANNYVGMPLFVAIAVQVMLQ